MVFQQCLVYLLTQRIKNFPFMLHKRDFITIYDYSIKFMGSFRLAVRISNLHENFNFTKFTLETVGQSLRHSCRTPIKCQGISLPLDRQSYSRRLLGIKVKAQTFSIKLAAPGRRQSLYVFFQICRDL